jgi:hypothetical protein
VLSSALGGMAAAVTRFVIGVAAVAGGIWIASTERTFSS